ncbi:response regulator [bacterium]|nr:response regulator [bacterium]
MSNYRVLLIDPDLPTTEFLSHQLSKAGLETYTANTSKEGLILAYQHRPHVIIMDPNIHDMDLADLLQKFKKDWRIARAKIIAFSSLNNPSEIQEAINQGFFLYLAKESGSVPVLIQKVKKAAVEAQSGTGTLKRSGGLGQTPLSEEEETLPPSHDDGKVIVFLSGKGGVGTSSLCANMAQIAAQELNKDTTLVDLVLPVGSLAAIVGAPHTINLNQAADQVSGKAMVDFLEESLPKPKNWNFRFLAGSANPRQSESIQISRIPVIVEAMKKISDYVFVDLGKSLSKISLPIIKSADQIVLTLSLDKATVDQTQAIWNYLKEEGITKEQIYFLINRSVNLEGLNKSEVEEILGAYIPLAVPYMGRNFSLSNNLNQPIATKFPQDAVTLSLRQATQEIIRKIEQRANSIDFI